MIDRSARLLLPCILCLCAHKVSFSSFEDPETLVKTFLLGESHSPRFAFPVAVFSAQVEEVVPARSRAEVGQAQSHCPVFRCPAYTFNKPQRILTFGFLVPIGGNSLDEQFAQWKIRACSCGSDH